MPETIACKRRFEDLHAEQHFKHLRKLVLTHPTGIHSSILSRVNSMAKHPAHKIGIDGLSLISERNFVTLKYDEVSADEIYKHKFLIPDFGDSSYSRSLVDPQGEYYPDEINLKTAKEITRHPESVRQLAMVTPLIMASTVLLLGPAFINQFAELNHLLYR